MEYPNALVLFIGPAQTTSSCCVVFAQENTAIKVIGVSMSVSKHTMIQMYVMIMHVYMFYCNNYDNQVQLIFLQVLHVCKL